MAGAGDQHFFAASRGYYTDGETFLQIIGLGRINNLSFPVRESKLNERNIKLGDFLSATVPLGKPVKNFVLRKYEFNVSVDGNYAKVNDQEGDLERNSDGILVFRNKTFGLLRSVNQNLPIGKYKISIRATKVSETDLYKNMKYCAEEKERLNIPLKNSLEKYKITIRATESSKDNLYKNMRYCAEEKERINIPSKNMVVGTGFAMSNLSISGNKTMKAFVYNVLKRGDLMTHFLWICDNQEKSIFTSKTHNLAIGHFFEGIFKEDSHGKSKWQCVKYVKSINSLLEGSIVNGRIELKTRINRYRKGSGQLFPTVQSEYLGTIIDNKEKLPLGCDGRLIKTQMCKVGSDFEWVVIELI